MSEITRWAIIDAAAEPDTLTMLEQFDPPHASLYADPVDDSLARLAPYLVQINVQVSQWLKSRETPWGMMLESTADMKTLRQHLRKYLHVQIPGEEKPVFFRFYDPRNIWALLSVISPWEQHSFLGPVIAVATHWQGELKQENFAALREQFSAGSASRRKVMQISPEQMEALTAIFEQRYIDTLVARIDGWNRDTGRTDIRTSPQIVGDTFRWLKAQDITDDRSVRGLFFLFHQRECLTLDTLPSRFRVVLSAEGEPGAFKAETLLIQELGNVPL